MAGSILLILEEYVAGRVAPASIVLTVRRALAKRADIYTHTNLKGDLMQRNLDVRGEGRERGGCRPVKNITQEKVDLCVVVSSHLQYCELGLPVEPRGW